MRLTLLKEDDIVRLETEEVLLLEKGLSILASWSRGHDVPGHSDWLAGGGGVLAGEMLEAQDPFSLELEEALVAGKADVVAALWRARAEPCSLATSHEEDADVALGDGLEAEVSKLVYLGGVGFALNGRLHAGGRWGSDLGRLSRACLVVSSDGSVEDLVDTLDIEAVKLCSKGMLLVGRELVPECKEVGLTSSLVARLERGDIDGGRHGHKDQGKWIWKRKKKEQTIYAASCP